ncbi:MAG: ribonuclease HI [Planctomycetes bacterium]|nr:ribonuclease HI [Planctomycetota bacterium]
MTESASDRKSVDIWSDGACLGNPGPGGYGILMQFGTHRRELLAGFRRTTNNRMELLGAIEGLAALTKPCIVTLHSDSTYVVKAMRLCWPQIWRDRGWRKKDRLPIANQDLWLRMLEVVGQHTVTWHWLKGHAGHAENERCDALANQAARGSELSIDQCYEEKVP